MYRLQAMTMASALSRLSYHLPHFMATFKFILCVPMLLHYAAIFSNSNNKNTIKQSIIKYIYVAYNAINNETSNVSINVILRIVRVIIVAMEKQKVLHILGVGL